MANVGAMKSAAPLGSDLGVRCRGVAMKIITAYLIRAHMGPFLFAFTVLTGLLFLNAFAVRMADLVGKGLAWSVIGEFVLLSLPHTVALTLPMAILVSVLYTFSELTGANEITAMAAGGIRPLRMLLPLLGIGTIFAGLMLFFNDQVLPDSNHRLKSLIIDVAQKSPTFELRERVVNEIDTEDRNGAVYLQAATIDAVTNEMTEVVIYDLTDPNAHRTIYAERGTMAFSESGTDLYLTLYDGVVHEVQSDRIGGFQRLFFDKQIIPLRGVGNELVRRAGGAERSDREMGFALLAENARARQIELDSVEAASYATTLQAVRLALGRPTDNDSAAAWDLRAGRARGLVAGTGDGETLLSRDPVTQGAVISSRTRSIRGESLEQTAYRYQVEIHKKLAIAFACIVFTLLGPPLALRFPRGGVGMVVLASSLIFSIYWTGLIGGEILADRKIASPAVTMWTANVVFFIVGIVLVSRMGHAGSTVRGGKLDDLMGNLGDSLARLLRGRKEGMAP